jgi:Fe-S-cluster containining protein
MCSGACRVKPGQFSPVGLMKFLKHENLTLYQAVDQNLVQFDIGFIKIGPKIQSYVTVIPASVGKSQWHPFSRGGPCVFLDKNGRCKLHNRGLKPKECETYHHQNETWYQDAANILKEWAQFHLQKPGFFNLPDLRQYPAIEKMKMQIAIGEVKAKGQWDNSFI